MRANIFGWLGILFTSLLGWQTFSGHGLLIVVGAHYRVYVQHCWLVFLGLVWCVGCGLLVNCIVVVCIFIFV